MSEKSGFSLLEPVIVESLRVFLKISDTTYEQKMAAADDAIALSAAISAKRQADSLAKISKILAAIGVVMMAERFPEKAVAAVEKAKLEKLEGPKDAY